MAESLRGLVKSLEAAPAPETEQAAVQPPAAAPVPAAMQAQAADGGAVQELTTDELLRKTLKDLGTSVAGLETRLKQIEEAGTPRGVLRRAADPGSGQDQVAVEKSQPEVPRAVTRASNVMLSAMGLPEQPVQ